VRTQPASNTRYDDYYAHPPNPPPGPLYVTGAQQPPYYPPPPIGQKRAGEDALVGAEEHAAKRQKTGSSKRFVAGAAVTSSGRGLGLGNVLGCIGPSVHPHVQASQQPGPQQQQTTRLSSPSTPSPSHAPPSPFPNSSLFPNPSLNPNAPPPAPKPPKEVINAAIVAYLRTHIETEDGYYDFAGSKGRLLPIPDLLKGYRFATRIVNAWANRKTPITALGCPNKRITKVRVNI
jgi:hypothetical protein